MSNINDGGPAFPVLRENNNPDMPLFMASAGMSLRDWFAGQALAHLRCGDWSRCDDGAKYCYDYADAMIAARERKEK